MKSEKNEMSKKMKSQKKIKSEKKRYPPKNETSKRMKSQKTKIEIWKKMNSKKISELKKCQDQIMSGSS